MHKFRREVDHKLRVLRHADQIGDVGKACRYFGVSRASFYRGQEQEPGTDRLQTFGCPGALVDGEVVENDDVAALERGRELGFDISVEGRVCSRAGR